ncbi:MAG: hypothetical protein AAF500_04900 [Myxococcota bacterium]
MKERLLFTLTTLLLLCYACDQEDLPTGISDVEAAAGNAVVSTARLDQLVANPRDVDQIVSLTRIYTDLTTFANAGGQLGAFAAVSKGTDDDLGDCVTETPSLITYDRCLVSNGQIDGTIAVDRDTLTLDLEVSLVGGQGTGSLEVAMAGTVTIAPASLGGRLTFVTALFGLDEFPDGLRLILVADYLDIGLDEIQCPLEGILRVEQEGPDADTGPQRALFGPICGEVQILD